MAKLGRPFVYQSKDEKPATVSLRIPRDLYEQAQRYVGMRRPMTLTDLLLDGLRLRLETPADPRDMILSDDNTVIRELQEMVDAAVQAALVQGSGTTTPAFDTSKTALHELAKPAHLLDDGIPFDEGLAPAPQAPAEPMPELSHNGNAVIQEKSSQPRGRRSGTMRQQILALLYEHPEGLSPEQIRVYLNAEKPIGDVLQGMRRAGVVQLRGEGYQKRYFVA